MWKINPRIIQMLFNASRSFSKQPFSKLNAKLNLYRISSSVPRRPAIGQGFSVALSLFLWGTGSQNDKDINKKPYFRKIIKLIKTGKVKEYYQEYDKADALYHEALTILFQLSHDNIPSELEISQAKSYIFDCLANLALLRNSLIKAEKLYKETLKELLLYQNFDQDDNAVVEISLKLSMIYAAEKRYDDASQGYVFCIKAMEKKLLKFEDYLLQADEDTLALYGMVLDAYSRFLNQGGKWSESLPYLEKAFTIAEKVFMGAQPQVAVISNDLGVANVNLNQNDCALKHFESAVDVAKQCESHDLPIILYNLGEVQRKMNQYEKASDTFKEALKVCDMQDNKGVCDKILSAFNELNNSSRNSISDNKTEYLLLDSTK